jgi:fluoroquinolone transport system permease protein
MNALSGQTLYGGALRRFAATFACDLTLQFRNGFYYVTAFMVVFWILLFSQLPAFDISFLLPAFLLGNLTINTFYYVGGLVLLEKGEGTLEVQVVTPLKVYEYLASKVSSLVLLALAENLVLVLFLYGFGFRVLPFILGIAAASVLYILVGFLAVAHYDSINEYLFPSMGYVNLLGLPLIGYFGLWESWLYYLHPMQGPLLLLSSAFQPLEIWQWVYSLASTLLWTAVLVKAAAGSFSKHIIAREGSD